MVRDTVAFPRLDLHRSKETFAALIDNRAGILVMATAPPTGGEWRAW
jgi:hypothetical protein